MRFSIIVPVYNAKEFLRECLESICHQSYADYEVLLIDDGSEDNSVEICKEYTSDPRFILIQKENGGVSSARNMGIESAVGEYILFMDADDILADHALQKFNDLLSNEPKDVIFGRTATFTKTVQEYRFNTSKFPEGLIKDNNPNLMFLWTKRCIVNTVWGNVYKGEIVKQQNIRFDRALSMGEDGDWLYQFLLSSHSFDYINECVYFYRRDEEASNFAKVGYKYAFSSWSYQSKWYDFFSLKYEGIDKDQIRSRFANGYLSMIVRIHPLEKSEKKLMKAKYKEKDYILQSCTGGAKLFVLLYRLFGFQALAFLMTIYCKLKEKK
ncbi:glycosyltransferase family 2 protein [Clostridium sp. D33t1_170424_F3]|uniref:glycosyltransferase family 2 protein n=1 Tax=Clostridium sp. D33t1_170424_F3 TaxID=2787099 RepID=UPI0018A9CE33|nr:glycosyltransferase family 2 protein [Clostridium sp. D33t1_170424_F3]